MAPVKRADLMASRKKPLIAAIVSGALFGMVVVLLHFRSGAASLELQKAHEAKTAQEQETADYKKRLHEMTTQFDQLKIKHEATSRDVESTKQANQQLSEAMQQLEALKEQAIANATAATAAAAKATADAAKAAKSAVATDRHTPWEPSAERDKKHSDLASFLRNVSINNEVLVAVSNRNYAWPGGMLELWMKGVKRAGIKNAMVVALDDETKTNVEKFGLRAYRMDMSIPDSQKDSGSNHAVSALKFRILTPFIELGYAVLLSDVDVLHLQNPFKHLFRDSDVESMSDGWDPETAYGYNDVADDPSMGWARFAHSMRIFVFNSGYFYLRPTQASMDLLDKVVYRVESENGWDQALFNECIFFPNSPNNKDPSVTRRAMNIETFMNSKVLFKHVRHDVAKYKTIKPACVHVNYHPEKFERMKSVWKRYVDGDVHALDHWPDGSE